MKLSTKEKQYAKYSTAYILAVIALLFFNQVFWPTLTPNEIGDCFSGLVAPLALFWFVLAYFKQSEEVELTRQEMKATRTEMETQSNTIAKNETHARRDVFLQLQGLLIDALNNYAILLVQYLTPVDRGYNEAMDRYNNGDKLVFFKQLKKFLKTNNLNYSYGSNTTLTLDSDRLKERLTEAKKYCEIYEQLIKQAELADPDGSLLTNLYKDGLVGDVYTKLNEQISNFSK